MNIAIDGPSGAGKSTVAKELAKRLGILYLDTGALYRAIGLKTYRAKVDSNDSVGINKLLPHTSVEIGYVDGAQRIMLDGEDVTDKIREHKLSKYASDASAVKEVREKLMDIQRDVAKKNDCVLDGRDIGTCVLPNAEVKIFLTASLSVRAQRRLEELHAKGVEISYAQVYSDIEKRDEKDSTREVAPLKCADDAVVIDSTDLNVNEVCDKIEYLVNCRKSR
ncbi:MAG: (d)CMP kinase [Clostridia bacterium]|nr:(d)CMP kinase [Clostridia bacterium]